MSQGARELIFKSSPRVYERGFRVLATKRKRDFWRENDSKHSQTSRLSLGLRLLSTQKWSVGETFASRVSKHSPLWISRNPISPIGLRSSITVYTSQPKSRRIENHRKRVLKSHFKSQTKALLQCLNRSTDFQISVDRYSRFYQEYQQQPIGRPIYPNRSTDLSSGQISSKPN